MLARNYSRNIYIFKCPRCFPHCLITVLFSMDIKFWTKISFLPLLVRGSKLLFLTGKSFANFSVAISDYTLPFGMGTAFWKKKMRQPRKRSSYSFQNSEPWKLAGRKSGKFWHFPFFDYTRGVVYLITFWCQLIIFPLIENDWS